MFQFMKNDETVSKSLGVKKITKPVKIYRYSSKPMKQKRSSFFCKVLESASQEKGYESRLFELGQKIHNTQSLRDHILIFKNQEISDHDNFSLNELSA